MLARGYKNNRIQFFFNTPYRAVNSGRISEIKNGEKWNDIVAATQYALDEFLESHPLRNSVVPIDEPIIPLQKATGALFALGDDNLLSLMADNTQEIVGPDEKALLEEVVFKTEGMLLLGHNLIGDLGGDLERFLLQLDITSDNFSLIRLWSTGNRLRSRLASHDVDLEIDGPKMFVLDKGCAEQLRDLVQTWNTLCAITGRLTALDDARRGPLNSAEVRDQVNLLEDAMLAANDISQPETARIVEQQYEIAVDIDGAEVANAAAFQTIKNFVSTAIAGTYRYLRRQVDLAVDENMEDLGKKVRGTLVKATLYGVPLWVLANWTALQAFVDATMVNPAFANLLAFIQSVL